MLPQIAPPVRHPPSIIPHIIVKHHIFWYNLDSPKPPIGNQVRHILIILSFLLLSSPVIGDNHKGETLYGWGEYPDYVWKRVGEKDTHPVYKGEVENGVPNGLGILIDTDGTKYVGEFKDGGEYGYGTYTYPLGEKYVGSRRRGKRWNGTLYDNDGTIIEKWVNGKVSVFDNR